MTNIKVGLLCLLIGVATANKASKSNLVCNEPGECQGHVDHVQGTASADECLALCASRIDCKWYTFHVPTSACVTFHTCDYISSQCKECVSGEVGCYEGPVSTTPSSTTHGPSGEVELRGGSTPNEGNVYATNPATGVHGPVCDDSWDTNDAMVVCRQLGYKGVEEVFIGSQFGPVDLDFSYDDLNCDGTESYLDQCPHSDEENCNTVEGAGVRCTNEGVSSTTTTSSSTTTSTGRPLVELVGGSSSNEGNVFATNPTTGRYGPICDDNWGSNEANVVCRQLGYAGASSHYSGSYFGAVPDDFAYDDVYCSGLESAIDECDHSNEDNCGGAEGAGVACLEGEVSTTTTIGTTSVSPGGSVELVGGSAANEGNVYATNPVTGIYGPVCDDLWDINGANVVCRQLGFSRAERAYESSYFGQVSEEFSYDDVACDGTESALDECRHENLHNCGPTEGAGVLCSGGSESTTTTTTERSSTSSPTPSTINLVGGSSSNEGNVFATNPTTGYYGPVCDDNWTMNEADVVCRQLGFSGVLKTTNQSYFGYVPNQFSYDDVFCTGSEEALDDCQHVDLDNCDFTEGAGVVCSESKLQKKN